MSDRPVFSVPPDHPIFAGHFPGRPIVPAVMLLEWMLAHAARAAQVSTAAIRVREAKFLVTLLPAQRATLFFEESGARRAAFRIDGPAGTCARGVVEWA